MSTEPLPLPKSFNIAKSVKPYQRLRVLNEEWHSGDNYLATILLENFDDVIDEAA